MAKLKRALSCRGLFVVLLFFSGTLYAYGDCRVPHYRIGATYDNKAPNVLLNIAVRPEDLAPERLICLVNVLKKRYQAPEIGIGIFSSYKAASNYIPLTVEYPKNAVLWASQQHAIYYYNAEKLEEYLLLLPDGLTMEPSSSFNTRIDLPVTGSPRCKVEVRGRCLLEFEHIAASTEHGSGTVTLTAQIERSGAVTDVRVIDPDIDPSSQKKALSGFATQNLRSWRFERSQTKDAIRIAYSLEHVDTPFKGGINVQFMLPDRISIQTGPLQMP
jgi:hypothetical protein